MKRKRVVLCLVILYSISIPQSLQAGVQSWMWPAAGIGMLVGGLGAGLGTYYSQSGCSGANASSCESLRAGVASGVGVLGALAGGGIGALIGHHISSRGTAVIYPMIGPDSSGHSVLGVGMTRGF